MPALAPIVGLHPLERSMAVRRSAQRIPALRSNDRELWLGNRHEARALRQMAEQLPRSEVAGSRGGSLRIPLASVRSSAGFQPLMGVEASFPGAPAAFSVLHPRLPKRGPLGL